uniref:C-type lectin domain-containing protein n=1 Tax=Branchiostoma floridae TaxID=7739 RepID=C3Y5D0_BRAFL|eukprot:XP_002608167.1 hypothetical protein BRAFLDRAFT_90418 [Branchiostoma floridae]
MGALLGWLLLLAAVGRCFSFLFKLKKIIITITLKAHVAGETCGGPWSISGTCSSGLTCDKDPNDFNADGVCVATLCPPGVDVVNCFADPCQVTKCPAYPAATCRSNYCGGCNAVFFDANGNKVNCNAYGGCPRGYTKPWAASRRRSLCYRFERKPASYSQAEFRCRADGGRLVTIRSFLVQFRVSILTFLKIHSGVWIGLSDRGRAGRLVWSDGVKYDRRQYSHWSPRIRNIPGDNCVYLSRGLYRWQRGRCTSRRAYVCEYAP